VFEKSRNKPFWIWDQEQHRQEDIRTKGDCCFNHIISLPKKNGIEKPLYHYQKTIFDSLQSYRHIWIKKATGLGITEFMLRYMAWLCLKDDKLKGTHMCIVTGPRIDLAITLIDRMKQLLVEKQLLSFDTKETVIELNGVKIEAFPSHHLDAMRGLPNVSFILLDESDFFPPGQQQDARDVSERYIAKSDPYIVMVSTPNAPGGLFERIEKEPESTCLYKRIFLDYSYGLDKIYSKEEIERAKQSPSFEREYGLKYLGRIGNTFLPSDIEKALFPLLLSSSNNSTNNNFQLADEQNNSLPSFIIDPDQFILGARKSMGIDPAWGSSAFGIVITRFVDGRIQILYADQFERPDFNGMIQKVWELYMKYNFDGSVDRIYVDGANPSFIRSLKLIIGEREDYEKVIEQRRTFSTKLWQDIETMMTIVPVNFAKEHKDMIAHCRNLMSKGLVTIYPKERFDKLITSLRTAVDNEGVLDKDATSYPDIFDAFRLAMKFYRFEQQQHEVQ
jgi:hypothetical protein